ncbi:MAG: ABC transporter permease [Thaumarchaeota archaeon]|nr:ABC transporter permease [Nitrososphaerota archaeon]
MNIRYIFSMAWFYGFKTIRRAYSYVIASLITPLTLLFLIYIISDGRLVAYAITGGFIAIIASNGLASAGDAAFFRLQLKIQDLFVATNIGPLDYMLGLTFSFIVFSIPGLVLYAVLGAWYHLFSLTNSLILIGILLLLTFATSAISFIIAGLVGHVRNVWGIISILSVVMTVLPPTFYPYRLIPQYLLYLLAISPATPAAVLAQGVFNLSPFDPVMIPVLLIETITYVGLAIHFTRWREK